MKKLMALYLSIMMMAGGFMLMHLETEDVKAEQPTEPTFIAGDEDDDFPYIWGDNSMFTIV